MDESKGRSLEQLRHHFEVEHELAQRLLRSSRQERTQLFRTLYDELFERVPDHPRKLRRESPESTRQSVASRMVLLRPHCQALKSFLEFAPGDCSLAVEMCGHAEQVIAVDISDQTGSLLKPPPNFRLIVYDGYSLDLPDATVDLAFSYQFLEHLHPEDVEGHFRLIFRLLRPGGAYVVSTPHRFTGPHDISCLFSDTPQGFHFREWSYGELEDLALSLGFARTGIYRQGQYHESGVTKTLNGALERAIDVMPRKLEKRLAKRLFTSVNMAFIKAR